MCTHPLLVEVGVCPECGMVGEPKREFADTQFWVAGIPVTQGSMKVVRGNVVHTKTPELRKWRKAIAKAATDAGLAPAEPHSPIGIEVVFHLPRPASVKREFPSVRPDLDKLMRAVGDALDGVAYAEDGQVVAWFARKVYSDTPGAELHIFRWQAQDSLTPAPCADSLRRRH